MIWCHFFSSRRRHTRYWRDWSSDVCSSDLYDRFGDDDVLTLRDDLPEPPVGPDTVLVRVRAAGVNPVDMGIRAGGLASFFPQDRKRTRLNSSHANISYAVFCLKKNKTARTI